MIDMRSERNACYVLGIGLFSLVGHIIATHSITGKESVGALTIAVWILFAITRGGVPDRGCNRWATIKRDTAILLPLTTRSPCLKN